MIYVRAHYQRAVFNDENSIILMKRIFCQLTLIMAVFCLAPSSVLAAESELQSQDHDSCIVEMTGDVNLSGAITSADIIYLLNSVFLRGPTPLPCGGAGDVNCSGTRTSADIIYLVNFVFKSGMEPCDICTSGVAFSQNCIQ